MTWATGSIFHKFAKALSPTPWRGFLVCRGGGGSLYLDRFHAPTMSGNRYKRFTQALQYPEKEYYILSRMTTSKQGSQLF
ncbi:hypothetical protein EHQ53_05735 [Leptospira langatensis]|uniref:Uncharacterized protein n=1 Tax=Leptospira langatensis TaxID=2484983 RepID=A0A5F1ZVQ1_9LEPT|nr:hypothetical protein EHO57_06570 [Leptospira langatensis]TGL41721.1 hypothetical protein EHQ53_05735 [Leptospira langatensis]